jgi:Radical SAM superfamily
MLTLATADRIRSQPGRAVLLYLTDRCPVGCAHCSVSALPRGPRPDLARVGRLVDELCARHQLRLVGISGGEPFAERRALELATGRLAAAGKQLMLYTSGNWGRDDGTAPGWTRPVLARASCVVLSTDAYHAARIPAARYLAALRATAETGSWIAVQVIGTPAQLAEAERLLAAALGPSWPGHAEIRATPLLPRGRAVRPDRATGSVRPAAAAPSAPAAGPAYTAGRCFLARTPVVRYDGRITGCCNEDVVTGAGPAGLHVRADGPGELGPALDALARDPFLAAVATAGPAALTRLPRYRDLGQQAHPDICAACWALLGRGAGSDPAVRALALLSGSPR